MIASVISQRILERLAGLSSLCPELRLGQLICTIGMLAEDETGHSLWDVEDTDFAAALDRFAKDMNRRAPDESNGNSASDRSGTTSLGEVTLPLPGSAT